MIINQYKEKTSVIALTSWVDYPRSSWYYKPTRRRRGISPGTHSQKTDGTKVPNQAVLEDIKKVLSGDLGYYGYQDSGNQVFLGWSDNTPDPPYPLDGGSPQYEWAINANYNYANVAGTFWYYMCNGYSTAQALINLSYIIYGTSFEYTDLAMWLVVWGNVYLGLP